MKANGQVLWLAVAGVALVVQSFIDLAPNGPWDSRSFTRGVVGLVGLMALYVAWFMATFERFGLAPTVNLWKQPETTWSTVVIVGLAILVVSRAIGVFDTRGFFPDPAALILSLIGGLTLFNGVYVWAIIQGPLVMDEEE